MKNQINNSEVIKSRYAIIYFRFRFAQWAEGFSDQRLYFSVGHWVNIIELMEYGWHKKDNVTKLKQVAGNEAGFGLYLTIGHDGIVGWNIIKRHQDFDASLVKHLSENFLQIHNYGDYLILNEPENMIAQFYDFLTAYEVSHNKIVYAPQHSAFLNPAESIFKEITNNLLKIVDKGTTR